MREKKRKSEEVACCCGEKIKKNPPSNSWLSRSPRSSVQTTKSFEEIDYMLILFND